MTQQQYEQTKRNAELRGFESLSVFVRYVALQHDAALGEKVREIHEHLLGRPSKKTRRKRADHS